MRSWLLGALVGSMLLGVVHADEPATLADPPPALATPSPSPSVDAAAIPDPDSEVARRDYERGGELYDKGDYTGAIAVFQAAYVARPSAALEYDIARCWDRMGEWTRALDAYRLFWSMANAAQRSDDVRRRIELLDERIHQERMPHELARRHHLRIGAYAVGAVAIASVAVAGGLFGWARADRPAREAYCKSLPRECVSSEWADLSARANASYALFAIGAVAAVVDAGLWTASAIDRSRPHAWLAPTQSGLGLGATF